MNYSKCVNWISSIYFWLVSSLSVLGILVVGILLVMFGGKYAGMSFSEIQDAVTGSSILFSGLEIMLLLLALGAIFVVAVLTLLPGVLSILFHVRLSRTGDRSYLRKNLTVKGVFLVLTLVLELFIAIWAVAEGMIGIIIILAFSMLFELALAVLVWIARHICSREITAD